MARRVTSPMAEPGEASPENRLDMDGGPVMEAAESDDSIIRSDAIDMRSPAASSEWELEDV